MTMLYVAMRMKHLVFWRGVVSLLWESGAQSLSLLFLSQYNFLNHVWTRAEWAKFCPQLSSYSRKSLNCRLSPLPLYLSPFAPMFQNVTRIHRCQCLTSTLGKRNYLFFFVFQRRSPRRSTAANRQMTDSNWVESEHRLPHLPACLAWRTKEQRQKYESTNEKHPPWIFVNARWCLP
jgi:hypothetical protein